ncbi:MAG: DUF2975 domain-containing protein [Candidatus Izemoplasmatales bacterium]|nr:DUF2975 domain-containing protein [Candidatus Izemoplasmatales bacterium]
MNAIIEKKLKILILLLFIAGIIFVSTYYFFVNISPFYLLINGENPDCLSWIWFFGNIALSIPCFVFLAICYRVLKEKSFYATKSILLIKKAAVLLLIDSSIYSVFNFCLYIIYAASIKAFFWFPQLSLFCIGLLGIIISVVFLVACRILKEGQKMKEENETFL